MARGRGGEIGRVHAHADRQEEDADEQRFERVDRDFDGAAIFGLGQQEPGDEGAQPHGEAGGWRAIIPVPTAVSSVAAMKLSALSVEATRRKSGRSASRPIAMMVAMAATACRPA